MPSHLPSDEYGLLPPGLHDMTLDEVRERFGRFQRSERRVRLFDRLVKYVEELRRTGWKFELILNGSFIMESVDEPSDIDMILRMPDTWDMKGPVKPFEYNLLSNNRVRKRYRFHLFVTTGGSSADTRMLDFFQGVNPKWFDELGIPRSARKGVVRLTL